MYAELGTLVANMHKVCRLCYQNKHFTIKWKLPLESTSYTHGFQFTYANNCNMKVR